MHRSHTEAVPLGEHPRPCTRFYTQVLQESFPYSVSVAICPCHICERMLTEAFPCCLTTRTLCCCYCSHWRVAFHRSVVGPIQHSRALRPFLPWPRRRLAALHGCARRASHPPKGTTHLTLPGKHPQQSQTSPHARQRVRQPHQNVGIPIRLSEIHTQRHRWQTATILPGKHPQQKTRLPGKHPQQQTGLLGKHPRPRSPSEALPSRSLPWPSWPEDGARRCSGGGFLRCAS